jgi:hypothetical protein
MKASFAKHVNPLAMTADGDGAKKCGLKARTVLLGQCEGEALQWEATPQKIQGCGEYIV